MNVSADGIEGVNESVLWEKKGIFLRNLETKQMLRNHERTYLSHTRHTPRYAMNPEGRSSVPFFPVLVNFRFEGNGLVSSIHGVLGAVLWFEIDGELCSEGGLGVKFARPSCFAVSERMGPIGIIITPRELGALQPLWLLLVVVRFVGCWCRALTSSWWIVRAFVWLPWLGLNPDIS